MQTTAAGCWLLALERWEVVVSETGWASKGNENEVGATVGNARTYKYNMKKRLSKKKGTPYKPKIMVKAYVFALFNEDQKLGPTSKRNFRLFKADGSTAYDIGFTGLKPSFASSSLLSLKVDSKKYSYCFQQPQLDSSLTKIVETYALFSAWISKY